MWATVRDAVVDYAVRAPAKNVFSPSYNSIKDTQWTDLKATFKEGSAFAQPIISFFEQQAKARTHAGDKINHKDIREEYKKLVAAIGPKRAFQEMKRRLGLSSTAGSNVKGLDLKSGIKRVFNNHKDRFLSDTQDALTKAIVLSGSLAAGGTGGYLVAKQINNPYINPVVTGFATGLGSMWLANKLYNKYKINT